MRSAAAPWASSTIETELLGRNVLVTRMQGHMTKALAESRFSQFRSRLGFLVEPRWIIEQSQMDGFDPRAVSAGAKWFRLFREHQGRDIVIVSKLPGARMVAASLAFSVRLNITSCATLTEALSLFGVDEETTRVSVVPAPCHE